MYHPKSSSQCNLFQKAPNHSDRHGFLIKGISPLPQVRVLCMMPLAFFDIFLFMTTLFDAPPSPKDIPTTHNVFSVSGVSHALKQTVEHNFSSIHVRGEIAGLKRHTSGHVYFTLKDEHAVIDAVCWRGTTRMDMLREGLEVIAFGKITTYAARSKYQMIVSQFEPTGEGALLQLFLKLKEQLKSEGLFDAAHKQTLPLYPQRIGLITSATGAVLRDILHRLHDRYPCHVLLKPVLVQGHGAAQQVIQAIDMMHALPSTHRPDVLIIARGGGSLEDLFAFNDENLVRKAFAARIPIISAIGHETDFTLLDFVADVRAPTPTAAAEMATPVVRDLRLKNHELLGRMHHIINTQLRQYMLRMRPFDRIQKDPLSLIQERQQVMDEWSDRLHLAVQRMMAQRRIKMGDISVNPPHTLLTMQQMRVHHCMTTLVRTTGSFIQRLNDRILRAAQSLENLSYTKTLKRGFCVVTQFDEKGAILRNAYDIPQKKPFQLHFHDGTLTAIQTKESTTPKIHKQNTLF